MGSCLSAPPQGASYTAPPVYRPSAPSAAGHPRVGVGAFNQEVLFFPDPGMPCFHYLSGKHCRFGNSCKYLHRQTSLTRLCAWLRSARRTMDVCVFTITCSEIAKEIVAAHQRGVRVRIITDDEKQDDQGSKAYGLKSRGISVRNDGNGLSHMHHKFAVLDNAVLLNGSFNWTRSAVLHNRENVVISTDPGLIGAFSTEFNKLWNQFSRNR